MTLIKTYSPKNEALIVCPVFGSETRLADCLELEQQVAKGRKPEERRGCQACMMSSKCPTYWINRQIQRTGEDLYWSAEPKVIPLKGEILDQVHPILVRDDAVTRYGVEGDELAAIRAANEAASSGAKARPGRKAPAVKLASVQREDAKPAADKALVAAAMSGDLSAAVTRAVAKASETPAPSSAGSVRPREEAGQGEGPAPAAAAKPKPSPAPAPKPAPAPAGKGMSLLEMARAKQAAAAKAAA
jgi:hypothetical protein